MLAKFHVIRHAVLVVLKDMIDHYLDMMTPQAFLLVRALFTAHGTKLD